MTFQILVFICSILISSTSSCAIHPAPLCVVHTPNSILQNKEAYKPLKVGNRERHATCTGAAWFHEKYLAILNLYGKKITTYSFDEKEQKFTLLQEITKDDVPLFDQPEALAISPDGSLLAVINNYFEGTYIFLFSIDPDTHFIDPKPIFCLKQKGFLHNVRFTPCGNYVAYASFNNKSAVTLFRIASDGTLNKKATYIHLNQHASLSAKGIYFTRNNRYAIIAYALSISKTEHMPLQSLIEIYAFNATNGTFGNLASSVSGTFSFEDITLLDDDHLIALPDQAGDQLIFYPFDPSTGQVCSDFTTIQNPEAQLSFPHGITTSPDGNYLVATNYGTDTFNLYSIK